MIQMYEKILPKQFCEYMMAKFDAEEKKDVSHSMFEQIEIVHWKKESEDLISLTKNIAEHYTKMYDKKQLLPKKRRIESFRIKRYEPNKHCFPLHADAISVESCTRYLAFLFYLNDNEAGTKFYTPDEDFTYEAQQGNILVFPPMWMFPHEGLMPTEKPKYIMSTYFHYA
jgi:prolyl 4-hydroxylase